MSDEIQPSRGGSEMRPRDSERGLVRRVVSIQGKKPYPGNYVPPRWQQRAGAEPIAAAAARAAAADRP